MDMDCMCAVSGQLTLPPCTESVAVVGRPPPDLTSCEQAVEINTINAYDMAMITQFTYSLISSRVS